MQQKIILLLQQQSIFQLIATVFRRLLNDSNAFVHQHAVSVFAEFAETTCHESIVPECLAGSDDAIQETVVAYLSKVLICARFFMHRCVDNFCNILLLA